MRVLFTGGGTAGHVTPAIAIAEIILNNFKGSEAAFVGRCGGEENRAITDAGYKLYTIDIESPKRSLTPKNLRVLKKLIASNSEAKRIITEYKPDLIIGTGGYVSYPIVRMGAKLKIPTLLHESNAYPGLVTKLLSKKVNGVMLGIDEARGYLASKANAVTVGNPVRRDFSKMSRKNAREALGIKRGEVLVVSFGGSGGSERINEAVIELMKNPGSMGTKVKHIHASGRKYFDEIKKSFPELTNGKGGLKIVPYIDNMPEVLSAADIAITRSGAMTIAELSLTGTPAILVPSPNVAANHQYKNARALALSGAAVMLTEDTLNKDTLKEKLSSLVRDGILRENIKRRLKGLSGEACEKNIVKVISDTVKRY